MMAVATTAGIASPEPPSATRPAHLRTGLYVHVPFCLTKCTYCDFNTYAGIEPMMNGVVEALARELRLWAEAGVVEAAPAFVDGFDTVFFGGGTPSYLPPESITLLMDTVRATFGIADGAEVTLEANPDDVAPAALEQWRASGINRLSIGVQAFDDRLLASLTRRHSAADAQAAVAGARAAGFDAVSIDLMYGLPRQSVADWSATLESAIGLGLPHLSMYGLQIEPNTPLQLSVQTGATPTPDDELAADMYELAIDRLADAGYRHYEVSNWCRPGGASAHNLGYWRNASYLGVGPGAHSHIGGTRFWNLRSPKRYVEVIAGCRAVALGDAGGIVPGALAVEDVERPSVATQMGETMMLGLRLDVGVGFAEFEARFGPDLREVYREELVELGGLGLIEVLGDRVRTTRRGRMLGNEVFQRFV